MTDAKLQPSWPSYRSHKQVYCLIQGKGNPTLVGLV